jgi:hypothetical protein
MSVGQRKPFEAMYQPEPNTGCWLWTHTVDAEGYGRYMLNYKAVLGHRESFRLARGFLPPKGMHLDHLCRQRSCVNPDHLEPVTSRENTRRGITAEVNRAKQLAKTHCPSGHAYDEANTALTRQGFRRCRICLAAQWQRRKSREAA